MRRRQTKEQPDTNWEKWRRRTAQLAGGAVLAAAAWTTVDELAVPSNEEILGVTQIGLPYEQGADMRFVADGFSSYIGTKYAFDPACTDDALHNANTAAIFHAGFEDFDRIVVESMEQIENTQAKNVTMQGISAGGIFQAALLVELHKRGMPVNRLELVTTPVLPEHVLNTDRLDRQLASVALNLAVKPGRIVWRATVAREDSLSKNISWVLDTARTPRKILSSQYDDLVLRGIPREQIEYMAQNGIEVVYYAPAPDKNDRTVDNDASIETLQQWYLDAGGDPGKFIAQRVLSAHASTTHDEAMMWRGIRDPNSGSTITDLVARNDPLCGSSYRDVEAEVGPSVAEQDANDARKEDLAVAR